MTATKRHQPIVFALVCALVLIGGSLKAHAEDLFGFNPNVTTTYGMANVTDEKHKVVIKFSLSAVKYGATNEFEPCVKMEHRLRTSGFTEESCDTVEFQDKGQGNFRATWNFDKVSQYGTICNTDVSMKIKKTQGDGTVKESDYTDAENVGWGAC